MKNWILKFLYFVLVLLVTYVVTSYAESTKILKFSDSKQEDMINSNLELIQTTTIIRYNNKTDAIVKIEPLFEETYETANKDISFKLSFYSFIEFRKNKVDNGFAIVLNDIKIETLGVLKSSSNQPIIDTKIYYNEPLIYEGKSYPYSEESFLGVFESNNAILMFNYGFLQGENGNLNIKSMELSYRTEHNNNRILLNLFSSDLTTITISDSFDEHYNRDIRNVTYDNVNFFKDFTIDELKSSEDFYFNENLRKELNKFNSIYFTSLGIEFIIVLPLTYFLFIHKDFKKFIINKKYKKKEE